MFFYVIFYFFGSSFLVTVPRISLSIYYIQQQRKDDYYMYIFVIIYTVYMETRLFIKTTLECGYKMTFNPNVSKYKCRVGFFYFMYLLLCASSNNELTQEISFL